VFITLEGIDRSGKSTQAKLLAQALGDDTLVLREPGGTEPGERIRTLLKDPSLPLEPLAELILFCAARAQLVSEVIKPALAEGRKVVCDRFTDSSIAYQGVGRGLGVDVVERLNAEATQGVVPDLTILLRIDPASAVARSGDSTDRFESEGFAFQEEVARAYDDLEIAHSERIVSIDGRGTPEQVHEAVLSAVRSRLDV
jgi:dTMP kinase